eukprot:CAMPEP_0201555992 /NCGR_PEP_ID=MMETSP0173_2-20130828/52592_1 /ASSEMBLY_ACC=CAM_ASM_000268 /TAXON_ID=218659 /ORGANISM="Vexillifera sp., Strain DIVA3 564/2" /LENGTH=252 /DNA_ID=CAMNT_0047968043 /DNA_START=71 /DNA_END=825 /DNA_ORIENTATION=+
MCQTDSGDMWLGTRTGHMCIKQIDSGRSKDVIRAHNGPIHAILFVPSLSKDQTQTNGYIWTTSRSGSIRLWDEKTQKQQSILQGHAGAVSTMLLVNTMAEPVYYHVWSFGYHDGTVCIWEPKKGTLLKHIDSRYGIRCACQCNETVWAGANDGTLCVFHISGRKWSSWPSHRGAITDIKALPKHDQVWSVGVDGTLCIWHCRDAQLLFRFQHPDNFVLTSLAVCPLEKTIWCSGTRNQGSGFVASNNNTNNG